MLVGNSYAIPVMADTDAHESEKAHIKEWNTAFPLLNGSYAPGKSGEYIAGIEDPVLHDIANAEKYYFTGHNKDAISILEKYLENDDKSISLSAGIMYTFASLAVGKTHQTEIGLSTIKRNVTDILHRSEDKQLRAYAVLVATARAVLLHMPIPDMPLLRTSMRDLPEGIRQFAAYILAHKAYLSNNYERALAICDTVLYYSGKLYPIPAVHMLLISSISLMSMKRTDEAKERFLRAYEIAKADEYIEPFAENHMLLGGLPEICLKRTHPEDFFKLVEITRNYGPSWSRVHNRETNSTVTGGLSTTEFTVAMLYNQGWSAKEISVHMELSQRMVKYYISIVYDKLGISSREELSQFMIN